MAYALWVYLNPKQQSDYLPAIAWLIFEVIKKPATDLQCVHSVQYITL